jgi:hypothetical protein
MGTEPVRAYENTPAERVAASRLVLQHARSREDLHELLDALGLNNPPRKEDHHA